MRSFFVTILTYGKRCLLQNDQYAELLAESVFHYRDQGHFFLHAFVIMPDHAHFVISPQKAGTVEKCVQLIKGGFSYRLKKELGFTGEVWRQSFHDERLRDGEQMAAAIRYIHCNPVKRGLCSTAEQYRFSSAHPSWQHDAVPCG